MGVNLVWLCQFVICCSEPQCNYLLYYPIMRVFLYSLFLSGFFLLAPRWTFTADTGFSYFAALFAVIGWLDYAVRVRKPLRLGRSHCILFAIVIWVSLISIESSVDYLPWRDALQYASLASIVVLLTQPRAILRYRELGLALAWGTLIMAAFIMLDQLTGLLMIDGTYTTGGRLAYTFGNPNYFAAFLVFVFTLLASASMTTYRSDKSSELGLYLCAAVGAAGLVFLTGSRNGLLWLGIVTIILLYLYHVQCREQSLLLIRRWGWLVVLAILIALFGWGLTIGRATLEKTFALLQGGGASEFGRLTIWQIVLQTLLDDPLRLFTGFGWGSVYPLSMNFDSESLFFRLDAVGFRHAHSEPLELLLEGGLVGFVLGLALAGDLLKALVEKIRSTAGIRTEIRGSLALALLVLIGFGMLSVATRYVVVLLPAAIALGYYFRYSGNASRMDPKFSWGVIAVLLLLVFGNLYEATRVFRSDLLLAHAVRADGDAAKLNYFERAVSAHPGRITPRYEQFSFLASQADPSIASKMERDFNSLQATIPNFKNVHEFYAFYLANSGNFRGAAGKLREISLIRTFHLQYLADALFYHWVGQNPLGFEEAADWLLYRAFLAETRGGLIHAEDLTVLPDGGFEVVTQKGGHRFEKGTMTARIPESVRSNQPILRYYAMSEALRFLRKTLDVGDSARFLTLLSKSDQDKVIRLANKLEEVNAMPVLRN